MASTLVSTAVGTASAAVPRGVRTEAPPPGSEADLDARIKVMDAAADDRRARAILARAMHAGGPAMKSGAGTMLAAQDLGPWPGWSLYYGSVTSDNVANSKGERSSGRTLGEGIGPVKQTGQSAMAYGQLHVGVLTTDGKLYDKVRTANGDWLTPILVSDDPRNTAFSQAALPNGELHFTVLSSDGTVRDHVYSPGEYPGWYMGYQGTDRTVRFDSLPGKVKGLATAGLPNNDLHLELLTTDGKVWTNVRKAGGAWSGVTAADGATTTAAVSAVATANGEVRLGLLGTDKKVREKVRKADGTWAAVTTVDATGTAAAIAATAVPNALPHLAVVTTTGTVNDFALQAAGTWTKTALTAPKASSLSLGALATGELQLDVTGTDGLAWHTGRAANGTWSAPVMVDGTLGRIADVAVTGAANNDLHVLTLGTDGQVWLRTHRADSTWWSTLVTAATVADGSKQAKAVTAATTPNGDLHLVTLGTDNVVRAFVRGANGSWSAATVADGSGQARAVAATAAANGEVHVAVLRADGTVQDLVRATTGGWTSAPVATPHAKGVAAAATPNGELTVGVLSDDNKVWATTRGTNGSWSAPAVVRTDPSRQIAAAGGADNRVHLVALDADGAAMDSVRAADGKWTNDAASYGMIDRNTTSIQVAALPNGDLHVNQFTANRSVGAGTQDEARAKADDDARGSRDLGLEQFVSPYATASGTKLPQYDTDVTNFMSSSGVNARNALALQYLPAPAKSTDQAALAKVDQIVQELIAENGGQDTFGIFTMLGANAKEGSADDVRRFIQYHGMPMAGPVKGTPEFRIEVEALKARWASGDISNPVDWKKVLVEVEEVAWAEWKAELAGQVQPRSDVLKAEVDALTALQTGSEAMHQALGYGWSAGEVLKWQANPTKRLANAPPRTDAQATADLATIKTLVAAQAAVARKAANDAKLAADKIPAALAAGDRIADDNGLPRGRGMAYAIQSAQVTKASAAAALATANALDVAVQAVNGTAATSATLLANAQAQAAAARAQFQRQSAEDSAARAAALADTAKAKADAAAAAAANVATAKAQAQQAQADATSALERAKTAAANAETERQNAAKAKAEAEKQRGNARTALNDTLDRFKAADDKRKQAHGSNADSVKRAQAAKEAEAQAAVARRAAADAQRRKDVAAANAQALAAAAVAAEGTSSAAEAKAAAQAAANAAQQAGAEADQANAKATDTTSASTAAREAATTAAAAAARATTWAADAQANALLAYSTAMTAEAAAAYAIDNAEAAAKKATEAASTSEQAAQESLKANTAAVAATKDVDSAVTAAGDAAGQAYAAGQAAALARAAAATVTAPANTAIELGTPFATTDSSAGLAVLASQGAKTLAQQQTAVSDANAAYSAKLAADAKAAAERATGDSKLAAEAAARAADSAAKAAKYADAAQKSAATAATDSAAAKAAAAKTAELDAAARAQAQAAAKSAQDALTDSQAADAAASTAEKDAAVAAQAAKDADATAKNARTSADKAKQAADEAERSAGTAKADAAKAEEAAKAAEEQLRRDEAALAAQIKAAQEAAKQRHDLDARQKVMDTQARVRIGRANLAYLFQVGGVASKTLAASRLAGPGSAQPELFFDQDVWNAWQKDVDSASDLMNGMNTRQDEREDTVWKYFTSDFADSEPEYDTAVTKALGPGQVYSRIGGGLSWGWPVNVPQATPEAKARVGEIIRQKQAEGGDPYGLWGLMLYSPQMQGSADDVRRFIEYKGFPTVSPVKGTPEFRREVESLKTRWSSGDPSNPQDPYVVLVEVEETASAEWEAEYAAQSQQRTTIATAEIKALTALQSSAVAMHDALGNAWVAKNLMEAQADPHSTWNTTIKHWPEWFNGDNFSSDGKPISVDADLAKLKQRVDGLSATADQNAVDAKSADTTASSASAAAQQIATANGTPIDRGLSYAKQSAQVTKSAAAASKATALALKTAVAATNATLNDSAALLANASAQAHAARAAFLRETAQDSAQKAEADAVAAEGKARAAADAAAIVAQDKARIVPLEASSKAEAAKAKDAAATAERERQNAAAARQTADAERAKAATATADAQRQAEAAAAEESRAKGDADTAAGFEAKAKQAETDAAAAKNRAATARKEADSARAKAAAADADYAAKLGTDAAAGAETAAKDARRAANAATDAAIKADEDADAAEDAAVNARAAATVSTAAAAKSDAAAKTARSAAAKTQANSAQGHYLAAEAIQQAGIAKENSDAATALAKSSAQHAADAKSAAQGAKKEADAAASDSATASGQAHAASQQAEIARDTAAAVNAPADQAIQLGIAFAATNATAGLSVVVADTAKTLAEQSVAVAELRAAEAEAYAKAAQDAADRAAGDAKLAAQAAADAAKSAAKASKAAAAALKSANQAAADSKEVQAVSQRLDDLNAQAQSDSWKADESARQANQEAAAARASADASELDASTARDAADRAKVSANNADYFADEAETSAANAKESAANAKADAEQAQDIAEAAAELDRNPPANSGTGTGVDPELPPGVVIETVDVAGTGYATDQCKFNPHNPLYCKLPAQVKLTGKAMAFLVTCDIPDGSAAACIATGKYEKEFIDSYPVAYEGPYVFDVDMVAMDWAFTKALAYSLVSDFVGCAKNLSFHNSDCYWAAASLVLPTAVKLVARGAYAVHAAVVIGDMVGVEAGLNVLTQLAREAKMSAFMATRLKTAAVAAWLRKFPSGLIPCNPTHSFPAGTGVRMADGSVRPIETIRVGDRVDSAVGGGGVQANTVTDTFVTTTDTEFTELTVSTPGGDRRITSTQNHPYYDQSRQAFVNASRLAVGDQLQTDGQERVTVRAVRNYVSAMVTYDLTVDVAHTYFVLAGTVGVLVHNTICPIGFKVAINGGDLSTLAFKHRTKYIGLELRNVAVARVEGRAEPVYGISHGDDLHSEDMIINQLKPGEKITEIYSERQPCPRCAGNLGEHIADDVKVTWSVPWSDPATELGKLINQQSNDELKRMLLKAMGF
ncbi:polymorphic toxin-type HINT domain-containing protein [Kitasatospora albolonga]|uniref:polymorphic toxin-type HINT domain-containing protein n=1 Tax=Kitasatospora albolonga TaxID=68173 RepID=UPI0035EC5693